MDRDEVVRRLEGLDVKHARRVACALIGHSKVQHVFFGYWSCSRCGEQIGDTLGSSYSGALHAVAVDHHCDHCRENVKHLTWQDTFLLAPEPLQYLEDLKDDALSRQKQADAQREHEEGMAALRKYVDERRAEAAKAGT